MRQAIERAVQELVHPVVDRSIKIAMTTCEQIVRKDFALDSEESRMRVAAHHMMRNLTAGMAMITCREPLLMSIATNLKNSFATALRVRGGPLAAKSAPRVPSWGHILALPQSLLGPAPGFTSVALKLSMVLFYLISKFLKMEGAEGEEWFSVDCSAGEKSGLLPSRLLHSSLHFQLGCRFAVALMELESGMALSCEWWLGIKGSLDSLPPL